MRKRWLSSLFNVAVAITLCPTAFASQNEAGTSLTFSNPTVIVALLGAVVTVIGWAVTNIYSTIHEASTRRQLARLEHLRKRIEEFYGPLVGIIRQTFVVYEIASQVLPTNDHGDIDHSKFQGKDIDAWRFFRSDTSFL
jgi:hypothetical protein